MLTGKVNSEAGAVPQSRRFRLRRSILSLQAGHLFYFARTSAWRFRSNGGRASRACSAPWIVLRGVERVTAFARHRWRVSCQRGKSKSTFDAKLLVNAMQVKFDCSFGDIQFARDRFVCKSIDREKHDLVFARAQRIPIEGEALSVRLHHCARPKTQWDLHRNEFIRMTSNRK